jgi:hypothetical protein
MKQIIISQVIDVGLVDLRPWGKQTRIVFQDSFTVQRLASLHGKILPKDPLACGSRMGLACSFVAHRTELS